MAYNQTPPTMDPSQKPTIGGTNETPPYVGKPKPSRIGGASSGGKFDAQAWLAGNQRPRPTMVLPGQGQGPMPVGTKPLPQPSIRDARGDLGMIRDASMNRYPGVPNWGGGMGVPRGSGGYDGRPLGVVDGDRRPPGWDGGGVDTGFSGGGQIGFNNDPRYGGGMMKPPAMPGGESVAPGMGMLTQYGGGPSGRGGVEVPYDGMNGAVQRGPGAQGVPLGGKPPQGPQPGMPGQGGGRQPLRPGMEYRPGGGQRPVNGGGMQAPPGMDPGIWAGMDEETKRRWMGMAGGGGMQGAPQDGNGQQWMPNQQQQQQIQEMMNNVNQQVPYNPHNGSPYYGAF